MPELPAVEFGRRLIEANLLGHQITRATILEDPRVYGDVSGEALKAALEGQHILEAHRHGKQLWLVLRQGETQDAVYLLMHFGMTGFVKVRGVDRLLYKSVPESSKFVDEEEHWPPRFCKMILETNKGTLMAFCDARRLGRVRLLREEPRSCPPVSELGFDPILTMPACDENFAARVRSRAVPLKTLLLDQTFAAGVGNWMADDIMLAARIHPETRSSTLSDQQISQLHQAIKFISETAVNVNADPSQFPANWLFHQRWPRDRKAASGLIDGHPIQYATVSGRTTAFVPALQKKTDPIASPDLSDEHQSPITKAFRPKKSKRVKRE